MQSNIHHLGRLVFHWKTRRSLYNRRRCTIYYSLCIQESIRVCLLVSQGYFYDNKAENMRFKVAIT